MQFIQQAVKKVSVLYYSCTKQEMIMALGKQMANLEKCQEDPELLERFKRYLNNGMKAA
jgi:hypothetical protein